MKTTQDRRSSKSLWRYWVTLITLVFLALLITFLIFTLYISNRAVQTFLHPPRFHTPNNFLANANIPYREVELATRDGIKLAAWYTPPQNGAVILLAHGFTGNRTQTPYALFANHGYGVLAWDARAHGDSGGTLSTIGYDEQLDVEAALAYARSQPGVKHLGAWGGSMGAAILIIAAATHPEIEALVSDSAFPTLQEALSLNMPKYARPLEFFWWEQLSGARLNQIQPVERIAEISPRAVYIIDGWSDGAIVMNSPYRLYDAARAPKQIWVERDVPHMGMKYFYPKQYEQKVITFFDQWLLRK